MGCKNVGDSSKKPKKNQHQQEHQKEQQKEAAVNDRKEQKVIREDGKTTKITKQVIETVEPDGTVVTRTVIQKSIEGGGTEVKEDYKKKYESSSNRNNNNNNKKKEKEIARKDSSSDSSDSDKGKGKGGELNLQAFIKESLQVHNQLRSKHKASPLRINQELNKIAQKYAEKIAKSNNFAHSDNTFKGDSLGENLFMCGGYLITGKEMSQSWYDEIKDYDFKKANFSSGTGHFTQLIWAGTTEVGFGAAQAKDGSYYGVANYYPAGNFIGQFAENVKRA